MKEGHVAYVWSEGMLKFLSFIRAAQQNTKFIHDYSVSKDYMEQ